MRFHDNRRCEQEKRQYNPVSPGKPASRFDGYLHELFSNPNDNNAKMGAAHFTSSMDVTEKVDDKQARRDWFGRGRDQDSLRIVPEQR
jgi:hypothetical protein